MTIGAGDPLLIDTNILVFSSESRAPFHETAVQAISAHYGAGTELWVSRQILREYLAALTRPQTWGSPQPISRLVADVRSFEAVFHVAEDRSEVTAHLLSLLEEIPAAGKQVHDANIVATMRAYGISRLLTHNEGDFARYAGIITVVPLSAAL